MDKIWYPFCKIFGSDKDKDKGKDKKDSKLETAKTIGSAIMNNKDTILSFAKKIFN